MNFNKDRRRAVAWRLRAYVDAIKEMQAMTDQEWTSQWSTQPGNVVYFSRQTWIATLTHWALREAAELAHQEAA